MAGAQEQRALKNQSLVYFGEGGGIGIKSSHFVLCS